MKKKILSIALVLSMVLCLAGCGDKDAKEKGTVTAPEGNKVTTVATSQINKPVGEAEALGIKNTKGVSGKVSDWASVGAYVPLTIHNDWGTAITKVWMSGNGDSQYYLLNNSAIAPGGTVNTYTTIYGGYTLYDIMVEYANGVSETYTVDLSGSDVSGIEIWITFDSSGNDIISWC